jgi:hypothetical protein
VTVSVICVADRPLRLPLLVWSLIAQTHEDWQLIILDQSANGCVTHHVSSLKHDKRIVVRRVERHGDWGYHEKAKAARELASGEALMFPQDDSYYTPTALARLSAEIERGADLALCGWLYDLFGYLPMPPNPRVGHVDVGGFMVRRSTFLEHGWPDGTQTADGLFIERLVASGVRTALCQGTLFVRN